MRKCQAWRTWGCTGRTLVNVQAAGMEDRGMRKRQAGRMGPGHAQEDLGMRKRQAWRTCGLGMRRENLGRRKQQAWRT